MTFAEGALKTAVLTEAQKNDTNGQLLTQEIALDAVHHLPETPVFWSAGSMVAAVLNCAPNVVTAIMCVGAHQGNRYGVTIEHIPRAVIINHEDLIGTESLFSKKTNAVTNREKDYIATVLLNKRQMMKVVPIRPEYIKDFFKEDGTQRGVRELTAIFDGKKTNSNILFRNWLRAAFVAEDLTIINNADSTSQLQIDPELPATFTLEQSSTFYTDLKIGFDEDDHSFGTTIANGVRNCLHEAFVPAPTEEREVIDVDSAADRNVRPRTTVPPPEDTANDGLLQRILQLEESLAQQRRLADQATNRQRAQAHQQSTEPTPRANGASLSEMYTNTLGRDTTTDRASFEGTNLPFGDSNNPFGGNGFSTGSTSTFQGTTNPFGDTSFGTPGLPGVFGAPTGIGANGFSFGATAGNGSFSFGASTPASAQNRSVASRIQDLIDKAGRGHITPEDMNTFQILKFATTTGNGTPSQKAKDNMGARAFNLCGWAHLQPHELGHLHQCNDGGWLHYNKASTKGERESIIDTYFVQPLIKKNGRFRQIITSEFRELLLNWRLAPTNFEGSKPHGGLGPLSFVTRSLAEQENLEYFRTMNSLAAAPTTADLERTVPGTPKIPDNIDALITLLLLNQSALVQVIGDRAPPPRGFKRLIDALYDNYNRLTGLANFQALISNEIVYQLCRHLERYFIVYCTEADVQARRFPEFNIDFLIQGVANNNLSLSHSYGPIFGPKKAPKTPSQPSTSGGGGGGGNRGGNGTSTGTPASRKRTADAAAKPTARSGPGCAAIIKLVEEHRAKNDGKFPRLSDIRTANDFASTKDMCEEIGLKSSNCLMWGLYCGCKGKCRNTHQSDFSNFKPERALEILRKATTM